MRLSNALQFTATFRRVATLLLGLLTVTGCNDHPKSSDSPEVAASKAQFAALAQAPILEGVGISEDQIVKALHVDGPLTSKGDEPTLGYSTLVGFNRQSLIEISTQGPKDNLWSVTITAQMDAGSIDINQASHRLIADFLLAIDSDAWAWISSRIKESSRSNFEMQRAEKTFGPRKYSLQMIPADKNGPAVFGVLILAAGELK